MDSNSEKFQSEKIKARDRQRKRRACMNDEEKEKIKALDRERKRRKKLEQHKDNSTDSDSDVCSTSFTSKRLKVDSLKKKMEQEMSKYGIDNVDFLFEKKLESLKVIQCHKCDTFIWNTHDKCYCHTHRSVLFSELIDIGEIPPELSGLSYVEELLISKVHPMISIYRLKGGQYSYRGNVINFRQDVSSFCTQIPHAISVVRDLVSVCCSTPTFHKDFIIRRNKVSVALHWLQLNNKYYSDVKIDLNLIKSLPEDGYYTEIVKDPKLVQEEENISSVDDDEEISSPNFVEQDDGIDRVVVPDVTVPSASEQIKHHLKWPQICPDPINEFNTAGYIVQAFPILFPYGRGDYLNVKSRQITARVYFQYLMKKIDRRFSKHKLFPYFALNSIFRWEALSLGTLYMSKKPELKKINIEHLKDMVSESLSLPKSVMIYSSSIRGSRSYWMTRTYELDAVVDRFNLPTIFFSISAADHHWPRQFEIILVTIFITEVLVPFLSAYEYWFRFEWQMRGVAHVHGVLWLSGAPNVTNFDKMTDSEKQNVISYFNTLISAWNPNCNYVVTANHPCRLKVSQVEDELDDLASLVNTVQKHKCTVRCLKMLKKDSKSNPTVECKHHFPHKLQDSSTIEKNDRGHYEFYPRRNDPNINKFNPWTLRIERSNHDFTAILSYNGFVRYISKYASKGEVKSAELLNILKKIVFNSNAGEAVKSVIQKLFMNLAVDRDYSFQEVIHLLKGQKLYQCSRTFVVLNLSDSDWEAKADISVLSTSEPSHLHEIKDPLTSYSARPLKYETLTLLNMMKWFDVRTFKKYTKERIVRIIPRFKQENYSIIEEEIWRQNALLNIPWRNIQDLLVEENWEKTCSLNGITIDMFPYPISIADDELSEDEEEENEDLNNLKQEDWMSICSLSGQSNDSAYELGKRPLDISYPWSNNTCDLYFADLMTNFVSESKKTLQISKATCSVPTLSPDQNYVMTILSRQIDSILDNSSITYKVPRICVCEGFAGSGKSVLLQSMVESVNSKLGCESAWVMAPTGSSALHVNGQTIHSAVRLSWQDVGNMPDLKGETLFKWREKYEKVKFVFIEEYSMVGCKLIYVLHKRLCQLTEKTESFGGLFIWFLGNILQLPPVGDTPWFKDDVTYARDSVVAASLLYKEIDMVCFLSSQLRQKDMHFLLCLEHISNGIISEEDKAVLKSRIKTSSEIEKLDEFADAVHIFSKKKDVDLYNLVKLVKENKPVLRIDAENNSRHAKACSSDQALGLPQILFLSIGCRVMLKRNLWVEGGLVNGAIGTLIDIVYKSPDDESPFALIIKFDSYYGPVMNNGGIPIIRYTNSWYMKNILCSRNMFSIILAYAVTIYKSEGLTLPKVVFHVMSKEMAAGEYYVALSRVKNLSHLYIAYEGAIDDCPLFHLNPLIYKDKLAALEKLKLKVQHSSISSLWNFGKVIKMSDSEEINSAGTGNGTDNISSSSSINTSSLRNTSESGNDSFSNPTTSHPSTSGQSISNATEKPKRKHRKKDNPSTSSSRNQSSSCNSPEAVESSPGPSNSEASTSSASAKSRRRNRKKADPDNKPQKRKRGSSSSRRKRGKADSMETPETNQNYPSSSSSSNSSPPLSSDSNETEASNPPRLDVSLNGSHEESETEQQTLLLNQQEATSAASEQGTSATSEQRTSVASEQQQPSPPASSSSGNENNTGPNNNGDFRSRFNERNTKVVPLRHCSELIVGQLYQILNVQRVNTKFGSAIRAEIVDDRSPVSRSFLYLPSRFRDTSEDDLRQMNEVAARNELFLVYRGRIGRADIVDII
ncbi:ATP-dependent DNA helicase [Frankliniella fusca]|uniref:ATP-dependent DNA helicase n=1 Tax=Frankliniella fusca TaxID=407009 RepID=A0AAE1L5K2_9NEOP|nr:ATP-dependent DNA helicase [Frankliniella fusca]